MLLKVPSCTEFHSRRQLNGSRSAGPAQLLHLRRKSNPRTRRRDEPHAVLVPQVLCSTRTQVHHLRMPIVRRGTAEPKSGGETEVTGARWGKMASLNGRHKFNRINHRLTPKWRDKNYSFCHRARNLPTSARAASPLQGDIVKHKSFFRGAQLQKFLLLSMFFLILGATPALGQTVNLAWVASPAVNPTYNVYRSERNSALADSFVQVSSGQS